ncbi:hydroxymethylglutaryl-CoA lyase [Lujinxingia litoralis]|uniref:Hydroxymethylglutaryl-CoA lyase n=1 Tax=Lujinxingia litoralis TaxID=2211119 RepID=A0A328CDV9_9DELT|nr:hydroxymethylglutaryl-CoA lyase [Lujinxingia litoralis]RAL24953.1 hydroxymethylglutaryl-CoA lyase [Lujinxingia litoralis]
MDTNDIRFFEVGPRDGLQNESRVLSCADRVAMIEKLVDAGVRDVEIGSFVHPRWVPQMAQTDEVARQITRREGVRYWALVPNLKGLERAREAGVEHVAVFMSATEAHNQSNLNRSLDESLAALKRTTEAAVSEGMVVRAYISTVFGCPFEGDVDFARVLEIGEELLGNGAEHLSLGDTIGAGTPLQVGQGCARAVQHFGVERVALHLHDTQGLAVASALMAYQAGVRLFDGAVGGMGGCPYAPGAAGNLASEDLVNLLLSMGARVDADLSALCEVTGWLSEEVGLSVRSRYYPYWRSQQEQDT